jgi:hypothetical protein
LSGLLVYWVRVPTKVVGVLAGFGAGSLLAMLTNSLMMFAYERSGSMAAVAAVVGFCLAIVAN